MAPKAVEAFPRGRTFNKAERAPKEAADVGKKRRRGSVLSENLFDERPATRTGDKKKQRKADLSEADDLNRPQHAVTYRRLTFSQLAEGVVLLGAVKRVGRKNVEVSLPFNLVGYLPPDEFLIDAQGAMADSLAEEPDAEDEVGPRPVAGVLSPGQLIPVAIATVGKTDKGKKRVTLTMNLDVLNRGLEWQHLDGKFALFGAVKSKEEHGYIVDLGKYIQFSGFLPYSKCDVGDKLHVGSPVWCCKDEAVPYGKRKRSIGVTAHEEPVAKATTDVFSGMTLSALRVGMLVTADITSVKPDRVALSFLSVFEGFVDPVHLPKSNEQKPVKVGQKRRARIIHVDAVMKQIRLSMKEEIVKELKAPTIPEELTAGMILEDSVVERIAAEHGVYFKPPQNEAYSGVPLFAHISHLSDDRVENIAKFFKVGRKYRCRVLGEGMLDGVVNVSLEESVLGRNALRYEDIVPGTLVDATVQGLSKEGCNVVFDSTFRGLIPPEHFSDVRLVKKVREKFKEGTTIRCRILRVLKAKRIVILTSKKSLVKPTNPFLQSYEEAERSVRTVCTGYVLARTAALGVLVGFGADVRGHLPPSELGMKLPSNMSVLEEHFPDGKTLKPWIVRCDPARKLLSLSLGTRPATGEGEAGSTFLAHLEPGTTVSGYVDDASETELTVRVEDPSSGESTACLLPLEHLADGRALANRIFEHIKCKVGEDSTPMAIEGAMVLKRARDGRAPMLTKKPSLLAAQEKGALVRSFEDVRSHKDEQLLGYVASLQPNGAVIGFAGALTGFARKSRIADSFVPDLGSWLFPGKTVLVAVEELASEEHKLSLSLRQSDLDTRAVGAARWDRTGLYFSQLVEAQGREVSDGAGAADIGEHIRIGGLVQGRVQGRTATGVVIRLAAGDGSEVLAFAVQAQGGDKTLSNGDEATARVLDLDAGKRVVDVSLKADLTGGDGDGDGEEGAATEERIEPGTELHARVELVKEDVLVLSVDGQPRRRIVHALSRGVNDPETRQSRFRPGMHARGVLCGYYRDGTALMDIQWDRELQQMPQPNKPPQVTELKRGEVVAGRVTSILPMQVNVAFGKAGVGRIHITEAAGAEASKDPPGAPGSTLGGFTVGSQVSARVVAIRNEGAHVAELSQRDSSPTEQAEAFWEDLQPGKHLRGFVKSSGTNVLWISLTPTLAGRVSPLDAGVTLDQLNGGSAFDSFQAGQPVDTYVVSADRDRLRLDLSLVPVSRTEEGAKLAVQVDRIHAGDGVRVKLPGHKMFEHRHGFISLTDVADDFDEVRSELERLSSGSKFIECYQLPAARHEDGSIRLSMRASRLMKSSDPVRDPEVSDAGELAAERKVRGFVRAISPKGCFITIGTGVIARATLSNLSDHFIKSVEKSFPPGKLVACRVLSVDEESGQVELTLRASFAEATINGVPVRDLVPGTFVSGVIKSITDYGAFVRLGEHVTALCHKSQLFDGPVRDIRQKVAQGQKVRAKVLKVDADKGRISLSMKPSALLDDVRSSAAGAEDGPDGEHPMPGTAHAYNSDDGSDVSPEASSDDGEGSELENDDDDAGDQTAPGAGEALDVRVGFEFSDDDEPTAPSDADVGNARTEDDGSGSDDAADPDEDGDRKRKTAKEKRERKRAKTRHERELREKEEALQASMDAPSTAEDFERVLMGTPNSSMPWIGYMALRLSLSELDAAREIAERALKTVHYREELERMNVWVAYLNLEANHGDGSSFQDVYERASKNCDSEELHLRLIAGLKSRESVLSGVIDSALRKHRASEDIWMAVGKHYFEKGEIEAARKLLERSLLSLEKQKHIAVISKFAQFEYRFGLPERGRTVFEGLVGNLPKRVDLWSIYLDMETRRLRGSEDPDDGARAQVRKLFERCCALDLSTKKMKFFFKRYLEFEKEFGDDAAVERVKDLARTYVEAKMQ